jgi:hypothetical protein
MANKMAPNSSQERLYQWQNRLLPFLLGIIILMAVFFFFASMYQLRYLHQEVRHEVFDIKPELQKYEDNLLNKKAPITESYMRWKTYALLEQNVVEKRYHQVNSAMLSRVWTRYLGFVTGMILAFVGAAFILGKFSEKPTEISTSSEIFKASIYSSSPGLVLAFLGTILMCVTLIVPFEIGTVDKAVYSESITKTDQQPGVWRTSPRDSVKTAAEIKQEENDIFSRPKK